MNGHKKGEDCEAENYAGHEHGHCLRLLLTVKVLIKEFFANEILLVRLTNAYLQITVVIQLRHVINSVISGHHQFTDEPRLLGCGTLKNR